MKSHSSQSAIHNKKWSRTFLFFGRRPSRRLVSNLLELPGYRAHSYSHSDSQYKWYHEEEARSEYTQWYRNWISQYSIVKYRLNTLQWGCQIFAWNCNKKSLCIEQCAQLLVKALKLLLCSSSRCLFTMFHRRSIRRDGDHDDRLIFTPDLSLSPEQRAVATGSWE